MKNYLQQINPPLAEFRRETRAAASLFDLPGNCITHRGIGVKICPIFKKTSELLKKCNDCDRCVRKLISRHKKIHIYRCYAGIREAAVPLFGSGGRYIGCLMMGKCLIDVEKAEALRRVRALIVQYGLDPTSTLDAFEELPVMSGKEFRDAVVYLQEIAQKLSGKDYRLESGRSCLESLADKRVLRVIQYVKEREEGRAICMDMYRDLNLDRHTFERTLRKNCGERPAEFIADRNLTIAEDLMMNTDLSMIEVSDSLGYSYHAFVALFQKRCGISPLEFRLHGYDSGLPFEKSENGDSIPFG